MKNVVLTLASAAICAASAQVCASGVTLYGAVDLGVKFQKSRGHATVVSMDSGTYAGSRWGLKGKEQLTDDVAVSFLLESGFDADNGTSKGKLFNRGSC